jgi:hypothetical protein
MKMDRSSADATPALSAPSAYEDAVASAACSIALGRPISDDAASAISSDRQRYLWAHPVWADVETILAALPADASSDDVFASVADFLGGGQTVRASYRWKALTCDVARAHAARRPWPASDWDPIAGELRAAGAQMRAGWWPLIGGPRVGPDEAVFFSRALLSLLYANSVISSVWTALWLVASLVSWLALDRAPIGTVAMIVSGAAVASAFFVAATAVARRGLVVAPDGLVLGGTRIAWPDISEAYVVRHLTVGDGAQLITHVELLLTSGRKVRLPSATPLVAQIREAAVVTAGVHRLPQRRPIMPKPAPSVVDEVASPHQGDLDTRTIGHEIHPGGQQPRTRVAVMSIVLLATALGAWTAWGGHHGSTRPSTSLVSSHSVREAVASAPSTTPMTQPLADFAEQKVTITPAAGLHDGQVVRIVATGYTPGVGYGSLECADKGFSTAAADCNLHQFRIVTADSTGTVTLDYTVAKGPFGANKIVCSTKEPCDIGVASITTGGRQASQEDITFA